MPVPTAVGLAMILLVVGANPLETRIPDAHFLFDAAAEGAQIVVAGRVADPSLTVGPAMAHYGWRANDWPRLGRATMVGHLLECGAQVSGGYFADPGYKDVPDLYKVGFPIAEIDAQGDCIIGMGSIILSGAHIGKHCIIGAGSVITEDARIPDRSIVMGVPGKVRREATEEDLTHIERNWKVYLELIREYRG